MSCTDHEVSLLLSVKSTCTYNGCFSTCSDSGRLTFLKETARSPEWLRVTTESYTTVCATEWSSHRYLCLTNQCITSGACLHFFVVQYTYNGCFSICFEWDIQERKLEDELSFVYQARPHQKSEIHCYYSWVTDQSDSSMAVVATPWLLYVILLLVLIDLVCVYSWM